MKSSLKTPWELVPYEVTEVKTSRVSAQRGNITMDRAKNNIKVVKERPERLQLKNKTIIKEEEEFDLDVNIEKIWVLSAAPLAQEEGGQPQVQPEAQQAEAPDLGQKEGGESEEEQNSQEEE